MHTSKKNTRIESYTTWGSSDALEQSKPNVSLANKSPMKSNFGLMVHEVLKTQNIVFDMPIIYFNVSSNHVVNYRH